MKSNGIKTSGNIALPVDNKHQTDPMPETSQIHHADKDLFRLLLEFKEYAIIRVSAEGRIISWNLGAAHIYGFSYNEVVGQHFSILYNNNEAVGEDRHPLLQTAASEGKCVEEGWRKRRDGTRFYAYTIVTTLYDEQRDIVGFAYVTRDITAKQKLEEENRLLREDLEQKVKQRTRELETANKELEAFSYSVSHDLRAPLRAMSGYATMLKEDYELQLDGEGNRLINIILENAKMMGHLIDDLLAFSKMARLEKVREAVNMQQLVEQCLNSLALPESRPVVSLNELPACQGDKSMLQQVWCNLLDNALKYSSKKEAPQITISSLDEPQFHVYIIKDNGTGFDMKYAHKLFGVFQRLHRQDEFEGTGLGLALAQRIVSKHGGEIWAEAVLGQGATFYFSIPKNKNG